MKNFIKNHGLIFSLVVFLSLPINLYIVIYWVNVSAFLLLMLLIGGVGIPKKRYTNKYKSAYYGLSFSLFGSYIFGVVLSENNLI